jgi:hypothetical protein
MKFARFIVVGTVCNNISTLSVSGSNCFIVIRGRTSCCIGVVAVFIIYPYRRCLAVSEVLWKTGLCTRNVEKLYLVMLCFCVIIAFVLNVCM